MSGEKISFSTKVGATTLATIGVSLEWFDFYAYGIAAALVFPRYFFPPGYPYFWALVLSLVTYLVGFMARPVGAIVFGHIGDRYGATPKLVTVPFGLVTNHTFHCPVAPLAVHSIYHPGSHCTTT